MNTVIINVWIKTSSIVNNLFKDLVCRLGDILYVPDAPLNNAMIRIWLSGLEAPPLCLSKWAGSGVAGGGSGGSSPPLL